MAGLIALLLFFALPGIVLYGYLQHIGHPIWKKFRYTTYPQAEPTNFSVYHTLLSQKFSYFRMLTDKEQRLFVQRMHYIINNKEFIGDDLEITDEMKMMVAAALTQLTLGLQEFDLENLTNIHLTPEVFYSGIVGADVKGLTFTRGRMILSWADFVEGYNIDNDKLNLGLHELAHAFMLDRLMRNEVEYTFEQWEAAAVSELQKMRSGHEGYFLRDYAGTNIHEFWACCVECFFEAPLDFKKNIPTLYNRVAAVLNQDMAGRVLTYAGEYPLGAKTYTTIQ